MGIMSNHFPMGERLKCQRQSGVSIYEAGLAGNGNGGLTLVEGGILSKIVALPLHSMKYNSLEPGLGLRLTMNSGVQS